MRVSHKMQVHKNSSDQRERWLADYVSKEKMESVRDGCKKTLDELERRNEELESILRNVTQGTEQLKSEEREEAYVSQLPYIRPDTEKAFQAQS